MTHDEFLTRHNEFENTPLRRYFKVQVGHDNIAVLLLVDVREKAFKVALASRSSVYRGEDTFWLPISAFAIALGNEEEMIGIMQFKPWFTQAMTRQDKINLGLVF